MHALEDEFDGRGVDRGLACVVEAVGLITDEFGDRNGEGRNLHHEIGIVGDGDVVTGGGDDVGVERIGDLANAFARDATLEQFDDGAAHEVVDDLAVSAFVERFDLDLACGRRDQRIEVADPGNHGAGVEPDLTHAE